MEHKPVYVSPPWKRNYTKQGASSLPNDVPETVDWREKGVVLQVANQGQLGSSFPLVVVRAIESLWAIKHGNLVSGSVQEFIDCCSNLSALSSYMCVHKIGGLASSYNSNGTCMSQKYEPVIQIDGGVLVKKGDEQDLKLTVASKPVVAFVDASRQPFQYYKEGVYSSPFCSKSKLDHAMLIVGYGKTSEGLEYWLCQNTWGMPCYNNNIIA